MRRNCPKAKKRVRKFEKTKWPVRSVSIGEAYIYYEKKHLCIDGGGVGIGFGWLRGRANDYDDDHHDTRGHDNGAGGNNRSRNARGAGGTGSPGGSSRNALTEMIRKTEKTTENREEQAFHRRQDRNAQSQPPTEGREVGEAG